ncbi:MAG TPA: hypothetical protein VHF47_04215 [Acidimicrobiales bacterium]|nr:hypothetical protein [Acidimicrobiales bacterium]
MKTCEACGMPAPTTTQACGFCARPFDVGPTTYRLTAAPGHTYRWTVDDDEVVTASWRDGTWDLYDLDGSRPAMTLVPVEVDGTTRVALVDHRSRLVATFTPAAVEGPGLGVVRDGYDRILLIVRGDGPTGVHVIDTDGNVVALAGRAGHEERIGLDVLLLARAADHGTLNLVLGLSLLLELNRVGELRRAA